MTSSCTQEKYLLCNACHFSLLLDLTLAYQMALIVKFYLIHIIKNRCLYYLFHWFTELTLFSGFVTNILILSIDTVEENQR